jgi:membrane-bound lytic murein transglycosylase F
MRKLSPSQKQIRNRLIIGCWVFLSIAYASYSTRISDLDRVIARGELVMLTLPGATTYFEDGYGKNGFEYLLAKEFADSLGVKLVVRPKLTLASLIYSIGSPQGDFAAANLVVTPQREKSLVFSVSYDQVVQQLIYKAGSKKPKNLNELTDQLEVIAGSSHSEQLRNLRKNHPDLVWTEEYDAEMGEMIRKVHDGEISYTVADSLAYVANRHIYPNARKAFDISPPQPIAWAFPAHTDGSLLKAANNFLQDYTESGQLESLKQQLFAHTENFSAGGSKQLGKLVAERLPDFEPAFRDAANKYGVDWHLIAAIAYQESHWNPKARSPTGVRGLMMLTLETAKEMNVSNRLDPQQSLEGGVAYFIKLRSRLPGRITDPDRTLFALAAYNVGYGHLEDARILTARHGKNPDIWADVREHLPLLSKKKYFSTVKYGYARGNEPVIYVDNIRYYKSYLQLRTMTQQNDLEQEMESDPLTDWTISAPHTL